MYTGSRWRGGGQLKINKTLILLSYPDADSTEPPSLFGNLSLLSTDDRKLYVNMNIHFMTLTYGSNFKTWVYTYSTMLWYITSNQNLPYHGC